VKNKQTAFMKFIQKEYDFFNGIDATIKDELLSRTGEIKDKYKTMFRMQRSPFLNTEHIGFNIGEKYAHTPIGNLNFRKALSFAVDRLKLIAFMRNGVGTPGEYGFVPAGMPGYPYEILKTYKYMPDSALYYLKASRIDITRMDPLVINTTQDYLELMIFVQKEWSKLGIPVKIEVHPSSFLRQLRKEQQISVWRGSWIADYPDPENYLICFESGNFSPSGPNYFHFSDKSYDEMIQSSRSLSNEAERNSKMAQAENRMMAQVPCVVLFYDQSVRLTQNYITGLSANPGNFLRLREVKKKISD
jgi:peptide/nickel transport system substrate-binding protein